MMRIPQLEFNLLRFVSYARVIFAALSLALSYYLVPQAGLLYFGVLVIFLGYGVLVAWRAKEQVGMFGLLALFGDTVYFLIVASSGHLLWLASFLFLYILAEAVAFYNPVEVVVITGVAAVFCGVLPYDDLRPLEHTVLVAGALACGFAVTKRRQQLQVTKLQTQLVEAQAGAEKACEDERQRIASDFHDGPLQSFISLQMRLEILRKVLEKNSDAGMQDLRQLQTLAHSQIRDLRAFLHSMRPLDMDGGSIVATARRTAETFQKETGIPVTFIGSNAPVGLPPEMTIEVLQMIREALHNVQKHAGATRVAVTMEKADRNLEISIDDNGHGFNFAGSYTLEELELLRLGPASLKRRARSLSADLQVESRPGRGAGLKFRIPLQ